MFNKKTNLLFIKDILLPFFKKRAAICAFLFITFFLCAFSSSAQAVYLDNFNTVSYSNNNGTANFATSWVEVNETTDWGAGRIEINSNKLVFENLDNVSISRTLNLSGLTSVILTLDYDATSRGNETLLVQLWNATSASWETIATLNTTVSGSISHTLTSNQISATSAIRFIGGDTSWSPGEIFLIDNVQFTQLITDSDGDLIENNVDIDDDNDGITDSQELCGTDLVMAGASSAIISFIIDLDKYEGETTWTLQDPSLTVIGSGGPYVNTDEIIAQSFTVGTSGNYTFTILDSYGDGLNGLPGESDANGTAGYSIALDGSNIYTSPNYVNFGASSAHTIAVTLSPTLSFTCLGSDPNNDDDADGTINYQDADYAAANGSFLNANGVVSSLDADGDGVINSMDLDSDNDGIYDIIEGGAINVAGVNDANLDGRIDPVTLGANGLYDIVETVAESGLLNYTVTDTDSNGTRDVVQLDSDADGCNDVNEAGFTDDNSDGLLGPLPITINIDGLVTSGIDGYTTPADADLNSISDFQEAGTPNSITTQPSDLVICAGSNGSFSVVAAGSSISYQWQLSTNGGSIFNNLSMVGYTQELALLP